MSMIRYLIRSSLLRLLSFGVGIVFALVVTPVIVRTIGLVSYGIWALISATIANYLLLDLGLSQAISKFVSEAKVRGIQSEIDSICSTGVALNVMSTFLALILTLFLIKIGKSYLPQDVDADTAILSFSIYAFIFCFIFLFRTWNGILAAEMKWNFLAFVNMIRSAVGSLSILIWITGDNGLVFLAIINGVGFLLEGFVYLLYATNKYAVCIKISLFDWKIATNLLHFGFTSLIVQFGQAMRIRSQPYILVKTIGAEGVAVFSVASQLIAYFSSLILSAFGVFIPWFSRLQALGDNEGIQDSMINALWLSFRVSSFVGLCIIFYGSDFVTLWLGKEFDDVRFVLEPMALGAIFSSSILPAQEFLMGISRHRFTAYCNVGEGLCIIIFSLITVSVWGIAGIGWSFFVSSLVFSGCILPYYAYSMISVSFVKYLKMILILIFTHIVPQLLFCFLIKNLFTSSYLSLLCFVCLQAFCAIIIQFLLYKISPKIVGI